ncbi:MAG TPA: right-handed parallel beta-helix repeat-containing protein [Methylocella sp.]|jgi:hypothetical protein
MTKIASLPNILAVLLAFGLSAVAAQAQVNETWVSGHGTDSGTCTRDLPCRTFAFALTQTAAGGEIDVLDPAEYGTLTITQSVSIINDSTGIAAIDSPVENAIAISAGPSDSVYLRGLTLRGIGAGSSGVRLFTGGNVAIENCVIRDFANAGINLSPTTSSSFSISNVIASNNGHIGVRVHPRGTAVVTGVINKVTANNNGVFGITVDGVESTGASLNVTVAGSESSNNGKFGVIVFSQPGQTATAVTVRNTIASDDVSFGLSAGPNAILRVAHTKVSGNVNGVGTFGGGSIFSYGDNDINGNMDDGLASLTPIAMH